jgi:hypothetical protein
MAKEVGMSDVDTVKALVIKKHSVYEALIGKKAEDLLDDIRQIYPNICTFIWLVFLESDF